MKNSNLKKLLLIMALIFFIQNEIILLPNVPDNNYSDVQLISPQNDIPDHDIYVT